jgi:hypothetical protein
MAPLSYIYTWNTLVPTAQNPVQKSLFLTYGLLSSKIETPRYSVVNTPRFCLNVYSDIRVSNLCVVLLFQVTNRDNIAYKLGAYKMSSE